MSVEQFVGVPADIRLGIIGYSGLTYDKVLNNPNRYLSRLKEEPANILCVDIGTNDLCGKGNPPSGVVQKTKRFLYKLFSEGIRPRQIVLFSVIQRSVISRPGQAPCPISTIEPSVITPCLHGRSKQDTHTHVCMCKDASIF